MTLIELLEKVRGELPGCELMSVVSRDSGLSLATSSDAPPNDAAAADAFASEVHRLVGAALEESGLSSSIDDAVVQGLGRTMVSTTLDDTGYFWQISTRAETTLGFTQAVMRKYHDDLVAGVRALVT